jgi:hypothetical protein
MSQPAVAQRQETTVTSEAWEAFFTLCREYAEIARARRRAKQQAEQPSTDTEQEDKP